jgi:hypothetical protein
MLCSLGDRVGGKAKYLGTARRGDQGKLGGIVVCNQKARRAHALGLVSQQVAPLGLRIIGNHKPYISSSLSLVIVRQC